MSLHKLASVTIEVWGLPEYTGTDDELQKLSEEAELLLEELVSQQKLTHTLNNKFPELANKIEVFTEGLQA